MKTIKIIVMICAATMLLTACGGDGDSDSGSSSSDPTNVEPTGKTYSAELVLQAQGAEQTVKLDKLSSAIATLQCSESWLTVEKEAYSTGAPQVKMRWTENTADNVRKCIVTVTTTTSDKLIISVTQKAKDVDTGKGHDTKTDQPAY